MVLPFGLGYAACRLLGLTDLVAIMAGATLTATSVGITARVLADLGRLRDVEGQIILGAAVLDDILGLVILTVVAGLARGEPSPCSNVATTAARRFRLSRGGPPRWAASLLPWVIRVSRQTIDLPGTPTILALILAFGLAWLADKAGSAMILGAFAAGLLLASTPQAARDREGDHGAGALLRPSLLRRRGSLGRSAGARSRRRRRPLGPAGGLRFDACGVIGKLFAGYAPFWFKGNKTVIGVGMIPRGEVGLIFAQMGLSTGVFNEGLFTGVTLMVIVTTFLAPPLLKCLLSARPPRRTTEPSGGHRRPGDGSVSCPLLLIAMRARMNTRG